MKKIKGYIFIFLFTLLSACKTTNYIKYYQNVNEAQFYFYQKNYTTARKYYEQGLKKVKTPYERDLLYYASCLWKTGGDTQKVIAILDTNFYFSGARLTYFAGMSDSLKSNIIARNNPFNEIKWNKFAEQPIYRYIDTLKARDQKARKNFILHKSVYNTDSTSYKQAFQQMIKVDSCNRASLDSIFSLHGYLGGFNWMHHQQLYLLMTHSNEEYLKKNIHFLHSELKRGHIIPMNYALFIDRLFYESKGEKEYYGQYDIHKESTLDPEIYFKRANSIGLSPYFYYEDRFFPIERLPKTTPFYEYYTKNKSEYNCVK